MTGLALAIACSWGRIRRVDERADTADDSILTDDELTGTERLRMNLGRGVWGRVCYACFAMLAQRRDGGNRYTTPPTTGSVDVYNKGDHLHNIKKST